MNEDGQRHLLAILDQVRAGPRRDQTEDEWSRKSLSRFAAALEALEAVGSLSHDESKDWYDRVLIASGLEPFEPGGPLVASLVAIRMAAVGGKPYEPLPEMPPAGFLRMVPVPAPEVSIGFGGQLQILGVELYEKWIQVHWRLAPPPDLELQNRDLLAAHDHDSLGLPEGERTKLRRELIGRLLHRLGRYKALTDDVGTRYRHIEGGATSRPNEWKGRSQFVPAPPETARVLTAHWGDGISFAVPIPRNE